MDDDEESIHKDQLVKQIQVKAEVYCNKTKNETLKNNFSSTNLQEVKYCYQPSKKAPIVRVESLVELSALNTPLANVSPAIERRALSINDLKNTQPLLIKSNLLVSSSSIITFSSV